MRILAMFNRIVREMLRDKRTLGLMFGAPLLILTLIFFLFQNNQTNKATLAVQGIDAPLRQAMKSNHLTLKTVAENSKPTHVIRQQDSDGVLRQSGTQLTLTLANTDEGKSAMIVAALKQAQVKLKMQAAATTIKAQQKALMQMEAALKRAVPKPASVAATSYTLKTHYLYSSADGTYFDTVLPIMMGFVVFLFVFLISGIALLRERTTGTLSRLLATPIKRSEVIIGYLLGYGVFGLIQTVLVVLFAINVFQLQVLGNVANVLLLNLALALVALTMGLFVSTFAASEFQMMQFIPIIAIPQIFFSGLIPVANMPNWLQIIAHVMPLYYGANGISDVIKKGSTLTQIGPNVLILLLFALIFLGANLLTMRRYRQV